MRPGCQVKFFGYDNACNARRTLERVKALHPKLQQLSSQPLVVDKFHFKSHVGEYCRRHCNPGAWPQLASTNMSIAEQAFRVQGRLSRSFRYLNRSRFQFLLQDVCRLQQRVRDMGLVTLAAVLEEADSDAAAAEVEPVFVTSS